MTVQEFYTEVDGNYDEIMARLKTDARVIKFAGMFAKDDSYNALVRTMQEGNLDDAFRAAHTMKGVCQNMAFTRLFRSSNDITEALRVKDIDRANMLLEQVTSDYQRVMDGIKKLVES